MALLGARGGVVTAALTVDAAVAELLDERTNWRPRHNHGQLLLLLTSGRPRKQVRR